MPTSHPRHSVTETPLARDAFDELRARLIDRLRTGEGIDLDALHEVREHGWIH